MTDNQILHKALKKCGWTIDVKNNEYISYHHPFEVIFSHDFAKAFWGNDEVDERGRTLIKAWEEEWKDSGLFTDLQDYQYDSDIDFQISWMYHLRRMVMFSEPLKYLKQFLR